MKLDSCPFRSLLGFALRDFHIWTNRLSLIHYLSPNIHDTVWWLRQMPYLVMWLCGFDVPGILNNPLFDIFHICSFCLWDIIHFMTTRDKYRKMLFIHIFLLLTRLLIFCSSIHSIWWSKFERWVSRKIGV